VAKWLVLWSQSSWRIIDGTEGRDVASQPTTYTNKETNMLYSATTSMWKTIFSKSRTKNVLRIIVASIGMSALTPTPSSAAQLYTATIAQLQAPSFNQDCIWFTLTGITQADPSVPNSPWFALARTQTGFTEIYAMLLATKMSGATIAILTTGASAGGVCSAYAGVAQVTAQ